MALKFVLPSTPTEESPADLSPKSHDLRSWSIVGDCPLSLLTQGWGLGIGGEGRVRDHDDDDDLTPHILLGSSGRDGGGSGRRRHSGSRGGLVNGRVLDAGVVPAGLRLGQQEVLFPRLLGWQQRLAGVGLAIGEALGQRLVAGLRQQQDTDDADKRAAGEDDVVQETPGSPPPPCGPQRRRADLMTVGVISAQKKMLRLLTAWEENMPMMENATENFLFSVSLSSEEGERRHTDAAH
ncbi:hypothetical protein JZ751_004118 [Albula glossodonta]|uniref:Uncharacterized protein n=1 Tax=Albula glossodonta TaxID=121402 RepID=A0A8T2P3S1_9TELE|nr:hypothetical protein JZ751_004118 [Albula glossodonta]